MAVLEQQVSEMCVRHYSDRNKVLRQLETGELFPDAIDVIPCQFTYEETDEDIPDISDEDDPEYLRQVISALCGEE